MAAGAAMSGAGVIAAAFGLGAVWLGGLRSLGEPVAEGGFILVTVVPEPVALPGEAKEGLALGAGLPIPVVWDIPVVRPVAAAAISASAATPALDLVVAVAGSAPLIVAAPLAEVFVPPSFYFRQEPAYPERARRAGTEGIVGVRVALTAEGAVREVSLVRSSGSRLLDEAALAAARASIFTPASRNHSPVAAEAVADYRFELR